MDRACEQPRMGRVDVQLHVNAHDGAAVHADAVGGCRRWRCGEDPQRHHRQGDRCDAGTNTMVKSHLHSFVDRRSWDITGSGLSGLAPHLEESELLRLVQGGNLRAFDVLYRRHAPHVEMVCRARLHCEADVADAVQETFVRAFRHLHSFEGGPRFGHWLSRIARHVSIDIARKSRSVVEMPLEEAGSRDIADTLGATVQRLAVRSVLASLSVRDARLLVSHHVDGHSIRELASQWGLTEGAMAVALQRARVRARAAALRQSLPALIGAVGWRLISALRARPRQVSLTAAAVPVVAAAVVVMPVLAPALSEPFVRPLESSRSRQVDAGQAADPVSRAQADVTGRSRRQRPRDNGDEARSASRRRSSYSSATSPRQPAVVPLEPVEVPGTRARVHTHRPEGDADYTFGVRAEQDDSHAEVEVEAFDDPPAEPAHDAACTAAEAAPAAVYCERGRDTGDS